MDASFPAGKVQAAPAVIKTGAAFANKLIGKPEVFRKERPGSNRHEPLELELVLTESLKGSEKPGN